MKHGERAILHRWTRHEYERLIAITPLAAPAAASGVADLLP
jgi:hypothetical protein